ncbi:MAG TPA: TolC family protein [Desulfobacteraceae bacterium]|nr:TolC family protein [Desulfobacteraceae bacterium]|tara:strand:- start:623 stop:1984 length:1362 start_codon:yes stop_codon:yes gene_type:complete
MRTFIFFTVFFGMLAVLPNGGRAAQDPAVDHVETNDQIEAMLSSEIALNTLLDYAYRSNPAIQATRASWQAFIENYRIGTSYPDPQLMATYFPEPIETRLGPQDWNMTLSQVIPFPGILSQKGQVLEADVRMSKLKLDKVVKDIVTSVSGAYYELLYIQKAIEIARKNLEINQTLSAISQNAFAEDRALFYDVSKAQAQTAQIRYDILLLQELEMTEKTRLNTLLDREPDAPLGRAVPLPLKQVVYSLEEIYGLSAEFQEDILIATEGVRKSDEAVRLSRFENLPTFKLGLFYAGIGEPDVVSPPKDAGDDAVGVQLGLNLPLWFGKNKSKTSKAKALKIKSQAEQKMAVNRVRANISRLWFKLQNSNRLITLYEKELLPQALGSLQTAEIWYREGKGSFSDYLEVQTTAYNFQLSLERARADYGKSLVLLEQMAGVILDRKMPEPAKGGENQ